MKEPPSKPAIALAEQKTKTKTPKQRIPFFVFISFIIITFKSLSRAKNITLCCHD
jgi:hypothetical protein